MSIWDDFLASAPPFPPVRLGYDEAGQPIELTFDHFYRHMHFLGLSRRGKSRALVHVLRQLLLNRAGFTLIDPDGEIYGPLVEWLARQTSEFFDDRTIHLFDPSDPEFSPSYNPLRVRPGELIEDRVNSFMDAVSQMNQGEPLAVMQLYQMIFRAVMSPLAGKGLTPLEALLALPREEEALRSFLIRDLRNWVDEQTWKEIEGWSPRLYHENIGSFMRRMANLVHHPIIQRVFGQTQNNLDVLEVMDRGQFLLVNLRGLKTPVPELIGRALVNDYVQTARSMRRPGEARPHIMVIDECAPFLSEDIVTGLDRTSKVGLHFVLSHQRIGQLVEQGNENIRDGVLAGAQTKVFFGTNYETAKTIVDDVFAAFYDTERIKENVKQPMVIGYKPVIHYGGSRGKAHQEGRTDVVSDMTAISRAETELTGEGEARGETTGEIEAEGETSGHTAGRSTGGGTTVGTGSFASLGTSTGMAMGYQHPDMILPAMPDSLTHTQAQNELSGSSDSKADQSNWTESETDSFARSYQRARSAAASYVENRFQARGVTEGETVAHGRAVGRQQSTTATDMASWQEAMEPIIEWIATQPYSLEEERHRYTLKLVGQGVQRFVLKDPIGEQVRLGTTETVERLKVEPDVLRAFTQKLYLTTGINTPTHLVDRARQERQLKLRRAAGPQIIPPPKRPKSLLERRADETEEDDPSNDPLYWADT